MEETEHLEEFPVQLQQPSGGNNNEDKLSMSLDDISLDEEDGRRRRSRSSQDKPYQRPKEASENVTNRVYVGNLSWSTSWQDLKDHMRQVGDVIHANIFLDEQGRSKGCGIVTFSSRSEALEAIKQLNDTKVKGGDRPIFIREDREDQDRSFQGSKPFHRDSDRHSDRYMDRNYSDRNYSDRHYSDRQYSDRYSDRHSDRRDYDRHYSSSSSSDRYSDRHPGYPERRSDRYSDRYSDRHYRNMERSYDNSSRSSRNDDDDGDNVTRVFVGNLTYSTSWQDLKDRFRTFGSIKRADILLNRDGKSKGQGIVVFDSPHDAQAAIKEANNTEFLGRTIVVHEDKYFSYN